MSFYLCENTIVRDLIQHDKSLQETGENYVLLQVTPETGLVRVCVNGIKGELAQFKNDKWHKLKQDYANGIHLTPKSDYRVGVRHLVDLVHNFCKSNNIDVKGIIRY